ncbi:uncharacterized ATP-dependent helicase YprA isoform X2 [Rhodamnia argentea]|uniref:Uncharacterized ATP-dependent helicase YprA isoform X2 n=1 Tax=Rhodamnia argentea TaxID=178133 RepID=A0ABM3HM98_9MYRT|nr:uncharacterized ATP-dependent helicase YprA isoform X2 [Rhodamnia argentea]
MEKSVRSIQVRALTGESTAVSISMDKTIRDLKHLLKQTFPLAAKYPHFNLYHKGVKLSLQNQIGSYSIDLGEVVGFVPVVKKQSVEARTSCGSGVTSPAETPISKFADSAWSDMIQEVRDIASRDERTRDGLRSELETDGQDIASCSYLGKRKRNSDSESKGCPDDLVLSILQCSSKDMLDEGNHEKLLSVLESVNCLQNPDTQSCLFLSKGSLREGVLGEFKDNVSSCLCPPWLLSIMKAFTFLNIYEVFLQLKWERITMNRVKKALSWIGRFGIQVNMEDIENLSLLCPKVVSFVDYGMERKEFGDALVIMKSPTEKDDQLEDLPRIAEKKVSLPKLFYLMERRERSFRYTFVSMMCKLGNGNTKFVSLDDLLLSAREGDVSTSKNKDSASVIEKQQARRVASKTNHAKNQCHDTTAFLPAEMVDHLHKVVGSQGQIVHVEVISGRTPSYMEIPNDLSEDTKHALQRMKVTKLYSHQAESIQASLAGKNVAVATMTSSGKSLCYNVPVLEELLRDSSSCALYLFPTKALSQDQLRALTYMTEGIAAGLSIGIYDGDTLQEDRTWLLGNARLLITNPDMLHKSVLPYHGKFVRILSNLRYVVIDEAHYYKGAFGCHTALILRRLRRLCSHVYGSDPSFIFSTATSGNPREHCMELANLPSLELIQNDGSPSAQKHFVLWNSSSRLHVDENCVDARKSVCKGSSPIWEVSRLFAEMVQHGLRCIAFCTSRKLCELVLSYTQEILCQTAPNLVDSISSYRSGYTAEIRRAIESDFFGGKLRGIAATNALELGIDIGHLDVTLHLGFPGSIASLWQQAGRSGRREKPSLAVYVAFGGPLDQYFMKHPEKLFKSPIECCSIDAQNQLVLEQHLSCAAVEHPLSLHYDEKFFGNGLSSAITTLKNRGCISSDPSRDSSARIWNYIGREKKPSDAVNIRAIETSTYLVIDTKKNEVLEKIEESKAFFQVHEGAVYMRQGKTYLVKDLDLSAKTAWCQEADLKYYTKTRDYTDIKVLGGDIAYPVTVPNFPSTNVGANKILETTALANSCKVITTWFGFRRISRGNGRLLDTVDLSLPKYSYQSQAVWISVPQTVKEAVEMKSFCFRAGLHAASHALLNVVPLCIICNSADLAPECSNPHDSRSFQERILLYDKHPGGTGVSLQVRPYFRELLTVALEVISSCCCVGNTGCPRCVQSLACHEYNEDLHKDAAIMIIKGVLDAEKSHFGHSPHSPKTS